MTGSTSRFGRTTIGAPFSQRSERVRGDDEQSGHLFSYLSPEQRVPADHPLRTIRTMTDDALRRLSPRFEAIYATTGRPVDPAGASVAGAAAPGAVFGAQRADADGAAANTTCCFAGLSGWAWTTRCGRRRPSRRIAIGCWRATSRGPSLKTSSRRPAAAACCRPSTSPIDGTLLEAWAGQKSFKRKEQPSEPPDDPGNPTVNFHGERRSNQTHQSTTDPDSRLFKKAEGPRSQAGLSRRSADGEPVTAWWSTPASCPATGTGERDAATSLVASLPRRPRHHRRRQRLRHARLCRDAAARSTPRRTSR